MTPARTVNCIREGMLSLEKARFPAVTVEILGLLFKNAGRQSFALERNTISIFQDVHYTNILKKTVWKNQDSECLTCRNT